MITPRRALITPFLFLATLAAPGIAYAQPAAATASPPQEKALAGYPIVEARRRAISQAPFQRPLDAETIRKWMEIGSQCTIAEFELFLAPLSPEEQQLVEKIESMPPPIINRLHFEHLHGVFSSGGLLSLTMEEQAQHGPFKHTTPAVENELYGAFECVFASVGPWDGSPRYGDVIIRLNDSVREQGWATPFSGMHFIWAVRHQPARKMQEILAGGGTLPTSPTSPLSLGFDDRLHFSHYVVTEKHWHKALAYQAILVLRNLDDSDAAKKVRERFQQLLAAATPAEFWSTYIPARKEGLAPAAAAARAPFGYLEAKFPNKLDMKFVTAIEVPAEHLDEVRNWPEAKPYLQLIRVKRAGVD